MFDTMLARDIRQTLDDFRRSVDRFFEDFYESSTVTSTERAFTPVVDTAFTDEEMMLRVLLPGVTEQDVKVTVQNGRLVIEGERKAPEGWSDAAFTRIAYGKFYTEVPLPDGLDLDKVHCRLHEGVLDIRVPVAEQMKPRQIRIESGEAQKAIPASA